MVSIITALHDVEVGRMVAGVAGIMRPSATAVPTGNPGVSPVSRKRHDERAG
jgi:hypothetical protein